MRTLRLVVLIRQFALSHKELTEKLHELEQKYDKQFDDVFDALNYLVKKDKQHIQQKDRKRIGFKE